MAVAELAVIIHLEASSHGVVADSERIDDGLCSLDLLAKIGVEPVFINTLSVNRTVKAAEASTLKRVLQKIYHAGVVGKNSLKTCNHPGKLSVFRSTVGDDHHVACLFTGGSCR